MATLAITAAVQIGVGLLLNFVFAPKGPNVQQEGPRLNDSTVTSSAYGQPINIAFGTFRMSGNLIWSSGIDEVANVSQQQGGGKGGGGGGSVTTTTYSYFSNFQIAFAEGIAENVLQLFADGKLILDRLNTTAHFAMSGLNFRFYPGDETQLVDPLIEADQGVGNAPANRGLCHIVFEQIPLVNFGNRIPNITAVITFKQNVSLPFQAYTLLAGAEIPGSVTGGDQTSHMLIDFFSDQAYFFKDAVNGITRTGVNDRLMKVAKADSDGIDPKGWTFGLDGFIYGQFGNNNYQQIERVNVVTMESVAFYGNNAPLSGDYVNGSFIGVKRIDFSAFGIPPVDVLVTSFNGAVLQGDIRLDQINGSTVTLIEINTAVDIGRGGVVIQDYVSNRVFVFQENDTQADLYEIEGDTSFGLTGSVTAVPKITFRATFTKGGTHLPGTADIRGWCVLPEEEAIIVSNGLGNGMLKFAMDTGAILATNLNQGFNSRNNVSLTGLFAFPDDEGLGQDCDLTTINVDDLTIIRRERISTLVPGLVENTCYTRAVYDYRNHSLLFSRVNGVAVSQDLVVRVFLNRASGLGVAVQDIVEAISTRVGIDVTGGETDFTSLSGLTSDGFVISQQTTGRQAIEPLQRGYLFEIIESDFKAKSVNRGGSSVLTIPEDDIGKLSTNAKEQFIQETRTKEVDLPLRLNVRYSEKAKDYQQNVQFDKRIGNVTPTTRSRVEQTIDLPMVFTATEAKQIAQRLLYTIWEERLSLASQLGWKYIRLEPTDVITLNYRGELRTVRFSEIEIGADLSLEFRVIQQDARSNDSSVIGDGGSGFPSQLIPSSLPTKFLPLDIPLLSAKDATLNNFIRAYFAVAGFDVTQTFPGALLFTSKDAGASFIEAASAPLESAWGVVDGTLPDATQTVTWDTTTTITLKVARGISLFTSKTDNEVLNGANAIAVIGTNGPEILQFVNVTQIDAGTVQISRLLRGRRGTEDNANNRSASEQWTLLEFGKVYTFELDLSLRNDFLPYKAVTLNTQLEDAQTLVEKYTGQDQIPYSVKIDPIRDITRATNSITIDWERRTRFGAVFAGPVPLNESIEQYEIEFFSATDEVTPLFTKVVNNVTVFVLTKTDFEASVPGTNPLLSHQLDFDNWNFEETAPADTIPGWSGDIDDINGFGVKTSLGALSGPPSDPDGGANLQFIGANAGLSGTDDYTINQEKHLVDDFHWDEFSLDAGTLLLAYDVWLGGLDVADFLEFTLQVKNQAGGVIQTIGTGQQFIAAGTWTNFTGSATLVALARRINLILTADDNSGAPFDDPQGAFDQIRVTLGASTSFGPLSIKIYQMSAIVGRGRSTLQRI